jgi:Spy/CpxP family protein refolding chaperone
MSRGKVATLLLIASLALNLAVVAAFFYNRLRPRPAAPPAQFQGDLGLAPAQDREVREIVRKFKINSILYKEDILDKRVEIIEELGSPQCDPEKIGKKTEELNALENQLNRDFIAALIRIGGVLEPEQRLNLIYHLSRNWFFFDRGESQGGHHE